MILSIDSSPEGELRLRVVLPPDPDSVSAFDQPPAGRNERYSLHLSEVELLTQDEHLLHALHVPRWFVAFFDELK